MTPRQEFLALLAMLAKQTGEQLDEMRAEFYRMRLEPLGFAEVNQALGDLLESSRRFPTVAEIKKALGVAEPTAQDAALMLADRICTAIAKYGEVNAESSMRGLTNALGPAAMELVRRQGGWNQCVDRAGENLGVLRAQLRDAAQAYLNTGVIEIERDPGPLPPFSMLTAEGRKQLEAPEYLKLAPENHPLKVTFSLRGDLWVELGAFAWGPLGDRKPEMFGTVTRTFESWSDAGKFVLEHMKEHAHASEFMQQLGKARIAIAKKRASRDRGSYDA